MIAQLEDRLMVRQHSGNLRQLHVTKNLIDFASNDYLGLARSPDLAFSIIKEWENCQKPFNGCGSTGSRLLTGNSAYVEELENHLADFHGYKAGLIFNCGYMANLGLLSSVISREDIIFYDTAVHASMHDGISLSYALAYPFRHNDLFHLEQRLNNIQSKGQRFICIESIYSTDGSKAPLQEICHLSKLYNAHLIVDEAHASGIWGPCGRGLVAEHGLKQQVFAQITTFGKAWGAFGAIILGSQQLKQMMINFSRSFIYTTALPFHVLAAIKSSCELMPALEKQRDRLKQLILHYQKVSPSSSETQIQCIKIRGNGSVKDVATKLALEGFDVRPLRSPTVKRGHELLRICLHAFNTEEQISRLVERIKYHHETQRTINLPI